MKIGIISVLIIITASLGFYYFNKSETQVNVNNNQNVDTTTEETINTSVLDLAKRGGNYECTFSHTTGVGTSNGVVYISGEKIRGNFTSNVVVANMVIKSYMISDGASVYTWTDMTSQGYKVPIEKGGAEENTSQSFDYGQNLDYTCKGWVVDPSVFYLPSGVEFIEA